LARPIDSGGYGIAGLAIAQSIVAAAEVLILTVIMIWRDPRLFNNEFWNGVARTLSVTGFTVITAYILVHVFQLEATDRGFITLGTKIFLIILPTFAVHILISAIYRLEEVQPVIAKNASNCIKTGADTVVWYLSSL